jgi:hypothetical protein
VGTTVSVPVDVVAAAGREVSPLMFFSITGAAWEYAIGGGFFTVTFDAELTAGQVEAVRNRLLTKDETQAAARLSLLGHLAALRDEGSDPDLYVVLADVLAYLLGE